MTVLCGIPFGLERLPRGYAPGSASVPVATVAARGVRLNSEALPPDAMPLQVGEHAARVTAMRDWLCSLCGDYAPLRRRFIDVYLQFAAAEVAAHRAELAERLARHQGLYAPEDWLWSALRPLPRAWLATEERALPAEIAFWDGVQPLAIELSPRPTDRQAALQAAGIAVLRIEPALLSGEPTALGAILPASFRRFWDGEALPRSPFRRPVPRGVVTA